MKRLSLMLVPDSEFSLLVSKYINYLPGVVAIKFIFMEE